MIKITEEPKRIFFWVILLILVLSTHPGFAENKQQNYYNREASQNIGQKPYNRKDWPHWIDKDGDCQNTRQEILIATSKVAVQFKNAKHCTVKSGLWIGAYTGKTFTKASDVDIDHIVSLAHAYRHGADKWTRAQRRAFANDIENLVVVDDAINQAKSDKAPQEWLPPRKDFWCEYGRRWNHIKEKYRLWYSNRERETLGVLAETCR